MIDWNLMRGLAVRRDRLFTTTEGGPAEGLTIDKLKATIAEIERIKRDTAPNPLSGVTHLSAADNMMDAARRLAEAAGASPMARQPLVMRNTALPPGYIVGMRGAEVALVIGPDSHEQGDRHD